MPFFRKMEVEKRMPKRAVNQKKKVAVLGLGRMGGIIAKNLAADGFYVKGFDKRKSALARAQRNGAHAARSVEEAVKEADVICSSLPGSPDVREVYLGAGRGLEEVQKGAVAFEHSTISVSLSLEIRAAAEKKGVKFLSIPLSGSIPHLARRQGIALIGGERKVAEKHGDVLRAYCRKFIHLGNIGKALIMKLIVNHIFFTHLASLSEGLVFGVEAGVKPKQLMEFLQESVLPNLIFFKSSGLVSRKYANPHMELAYAVKDLILSTEEANRLGVPTPLGAVTREQYVSAMALGYAADDVNAVFEACLHAAGKKTTKEE